MDKSNLEVFGHIVADFKIIGAIRIHSESADPDGRCFAHNLYLEYEEFDQYLDKTKAKKAISANKFFKKKRQPSISNKPLSQNPHLNSNLIQGLRPNLVHNSRLKLLQIFGITFSKETWKSITDTIAKAKSLETLAINNCELSPTVLESLDSALMT